MKKITILALCCVVLDQFVKWIITHMIDFMEQIFVIPDFFYITNVRNYGAAWSILDGNRAFFIFMAFFCLALIYYFFIYHQKLSKREVLGYGLLIGGIIGNLIDRMILGYVVDYIGLIFFGYHYPVFNIADVCIVGSVFIILYHFWKERSLDGTDNHRQRGSSRKNRS
ncbi:MAG TPA: signal peptidase II [Candidatus Fimihabitans intestinipullorum]|uniref:Lipoprotein signal peptidase n=1 Tax=Candidatus Fimihabitans intestinipullorum TaxID=2840820 RepID=A0A9D1L3G5_9BACT|nr:signal peptidase II [Candidatus Fimihabitans intestinipullorum]